MDIVVVLLTAVGLAMDAFAVAVAAGASGVSRTADALRIGGSFGFFQMIMPVAGWLFGMTLKHWIATFDHWIAFGLLVFIGIKMIHEAFAAEDACAKEEGGMSAKRLLLLSVATSIDALAVGVTFAMLAQPVFFPSLIIGLVTFVIATAGVFVGRFCCCVWGKRAEFFGGIVLVLIGLKILVDHLR